MEAEVKRRKRRVVLVALAACLVVAGIGGTLAWFSAQSQLTNTFTVGNITPPTTDPDTGTDIPEADKTDGKLSGNLYEPNWVPGSKIGPGASVAKDPRVGIAGKKTSGDTASDPAYVYVYVKNNLPDGAYFTIGDAWKPVDGKVTKYEGVSAETNNYKSGLFAYCGTNNSYDAGKGLTLLATTDEVDGTAKDAWTAPLFTHIKTAKDYKTDSFTATTQDNVKVYAYLAAKSADGDDLTDLDTAAKLWADGIAAA